MPAQDDTTSSALLSGPVNIRSSVSLTALPSAVSALMNLGISAQVAVRGTHEEVISAVTTMTKRFQAVSAQVSLRGERAAGEK